jgi:hypothetical protein
MARENEKYVTLFYEKQMRREQTIKTQVDEMLNMHDSLVVNSTDEAENINDVDEAELKRCDDMRRAIRRNNDAKAKEKRLKLAQQMDLQERRLEAAEDMSTIRIGKVLVKNENRGIKRADNLQNQVAKENADYIPERAIPKAYIQHKIQEYLKNI